MAGLFKAKRPESDGIEFWHNPERSGWLMKQGACAKGHTPAVQVLHACKHAGHTCVPVHPWCRAFNVQVNTSRHGAAGVLHASICIWQPLGTQLEQRHGCISAAVTGLCNCFAVSCLLEAPQPVRFGLRVP
jgi:hypothetical protein